MPYIEVDHSKFFEAAEAVKEYTDYMKSCQKKVEGEFNSLLSEYEGVDAAALDKKRKELYRNKSVHKKMEHALEGYGDNLKTAGKLYKNAQADVVNKALLLPR